MRTFLALLLAFPLLASAEDTSTETACRAHLQRIGGAVRAYRIVHDGKDPAKLSDLYYDGLVENLGDFACPASGAKIAAAGEIDAKTDYTFQPLPGSGNKDMIVREKTPRHQNGQVLAGFADGSVKSVAMAGSVPAAPPPEAAAIPSSQTVPTAGPAPEAPIAPIAQTEEQTDSTPPGDGGLRPGQTPAPPAPVIGVHTDAAAMPPAPASTNLNARKSRAMWIAGGAIVVLLLWAAMRRRKPSSSTPSKPAPPSGGSPK